jgi:DNA adenine methylase
MSDDILGMLMGMNDEKEVRETYLRLPFGYPGSKANELHNILPHLPYTDKYAEPFGGSGIVLLNRKPSKLEVFNDRYAGVTCFFRVIRDPILREQLIERLAITLHSREEFCWCKSTWKDHADPVERAARWFYTIRYAVNSKPTSTFGRSLTAKASFAHKLPISLELFLPVSVRLERVQIENLDWRLCLRDYDQEGMVWYLDPSYLGTQGNYEFELTRADHIELCDRVHNLKGYVALSGFDNDLTNEIYGRYKWKEVFAWKRQTRALTQSFSDTNNLEGYEGDTERGVKSHVKEALWLKDFK